ncbi:MAG TPA: nitrilase-related carbon-nitrogen hydrolase [Pseudonocardia sp.]|nr:nitrilase-related carbon-nitrogen hydrolase [Pseudonocardia sp.]
MTLKVAACQLWLDVAQSSGNLARAEAAVTVAAGQGAQLVVLPELTNSGYVFTDFDEVRERAQSVNGSVVFDWCALARRHRLVLVAGFAELGDDGRFYNSAVLIDQGELRAVYRKVHLWDTEKEIFTPGSHAPPVLDTSVGRVAMMICYDLEFPEWTRLVGLAGAQVLAAPTNWPAGDRPLTERPIEVIRVQAAASVNRIAVVAADRCGSERGVDWVGGSVIVGPDGYPLAGPPSAPRPEILVAELDLAEIDRKSTSLRNDVFTDRRPDLY